MEMWTLKSQDLRNKVRTCREEKHAFLSNPGRKIVTAHGYVIIGRRGRVPPRIPLLRPPPRSLPLGTIGVQRTNSIF